MHKRAGESIAGGRGKKVRFNAQNSALLPPVDDNSNDSLESTADELFEAEIEAPHAQASRRHAVKIDGYESDSSDDTRVARVSAGGGLDSEAGPAETATAMDEDEDMFAEAPKLSVEKGKGSADTAKDKGQERFLALEEIPGQEFDNRQGRQASDGFPAHSGRYNPDEDELGGEEDAEVDNDDDSMDEEVGALGRKHNAPKLDAFNMKAELEQGQFDQDGNYIRQSKDVKDTQDVWLKDVSKRDIAAAREAVAKREAEEQARLRDADENASTSDLLGELVAHLDVGETLLEALQRLGVLAGKNRKRVKKAHGLASSQNDTSSSTEKEAAKTIERLTLLASKLMARLPWDLYGLERESLLRAYQRETGSALSIPSKATISQNRDIEPTEWEFRYAGTEEVHGPYSKDDLLAWLEEGRFVEHACEARQVGDTSFSSLSEDLLA